jgi:hypothetical protein
VAPLDPATGPPLAVAGTLLVAVGFYAATAHLAARYVLGSAPVLPAVGVGVVLGVVAFLLRSVGPAPVIAASLAADVAAIKALYGLEWRPTAFVAVVHYALSAVLGVALYNLVRLLVAAPA